MRMTKEMMDCIDEAFNKAEKYEEIKYLVNESTKLTDSARIARIRDVIGEDKE